MNAVSRGGARSQRGAHLKGVGRRTGALGQVALQRPGAADHLQQYVAPDALVGPVLDLNALQVRAVARADDVHAPDVTCKHVVVRVAALQGRPKEVADIVEHGPLVTVRRRVLERQPHPGLIAAVHDLERGARVGDGLVHLDFADAVQQLVPYWYRLHGAAVLRTSPCARWYAGRAATAAGKKRLVVNSRTVPVLKKLSTIDKWTRILRGNASQATNGQSIVPKTCFSATDAASGDRGFASPWPLHGTLTRTLTLRLFLTTTAAGCMHVTIVSRCSAGHLRHRRDNHFEQSHGSSASKCLLSRFSRYTVRSPPAHTARRWS